MENNILEDKVKERICKPCFFLNSHECPEDKFECHYYETSYKLYKELMEKNAETQ